MDYTEAKKLISKPSFILEDPAVIEQCINIIRDKDGIEGIREMGKSMADKYDGCVNMLYDMANWMHDLGEDQSDIQKKIEDAVKDVILLNYNKTVTTNLSITNGLEGYDDWCGEVVESPSWRSTLYELALRPVNEDCPILAFALACIALKEEYISELVSVPSAWHTLETLLKCLRHLLPTLLCGRLSQESQGDDSALTGSYDIAMKHFLNMGCHSEHSYIIVQSVLYCLAQKSNGHIPKWLSRLLEEEADNRGYDVSKYSVHFCAARDYPEAMNAMKSILFKKQLNQADITSLYKAYTEEISPPVELLRLPVFIDLLANTLFVSSGVRVLPEQQKAYLYLFAYAASVVEEMEEEKRNTCDRGRLEETIDLVRDASAICRQWYNMMGSGISHRAFCDMPVLLEAVHSRPVSYGVFQFIREVFNAKRSDFELNLEIMRPYCIVINELASCNKRLHTQILDLITSLLVGNIEGLEDLSQVEYKKMLVDLLIHLVTCGHIEPVVSKVRKLFLEDKVDISIVRHFVTEILDVADSPYSEQFMTNMLPLVDNANIMAGMTKGMQADTAKSFIAYCNRNMKTIGS